MSAYNPRGSLVSPFEGYPAYGAVHEVMPDENLRGFLFDFSRISDLLLKQSLGGVEIEPIPVEAFASGEDFFTDANERLPKIPEVEEYDPRDYYKIFDVDTLGVSVVEMDPSAKAARAVGALWEKQDFGAVEQEARDDIGRRTNTLFVPKLKMAGVAGMGKRLPNVERTEIREKLALMPDTLENKDTHELLEVTADSVSTAIRRRLKQFTLPWDMLPHLTFAVFKKKTESYQIDTIHRSARNLVIARPFDVRLGDLAFRHKSLRGKMSQ